MRLLTNNPATYCGFEGFGLDIAECGPLIIDAPGATLVPSARSSRNSERSPAGPTGLMTERAPTAGQAP